MTKMILRSALALTFASAVCLTAVSNAKAAPISAGAASLTAATPTHIVDVRWRRGGAIAAGVAAGLIVGGIAAGAYPYYAPGYETYPGYGPAYYPGYPAPVYVQPQPYYQQPPVYYQPRRCWVTTNQDRGLGYWRAC